MRNVVLLIALPSFAAQTISVAVSTAQVAPTTLSALALDPSALDAVKAEGTPLLPLGSAQLAN
jgi:hypothetical protein